MGGSHPRRFGVSPRRWYGPPRSEPAPWGPHSMAKTPLKEPIGAPGLRRMLLMCVAVGIVAGLGAAGFFVVLEAGTAYLLGGIAGYYPASPGFEGNTFVAAAVAANAMPIRWLLLALPTAGGLLSGWLVFTFAPEAEGHGTDAAIEAYHYRDGAVRARVPFVKALSSALTIGTGGSGGREGPIAQIGSGFGSMLGAWMHVRPEERRILMAAGLGAGVGAIFHAPLAGALFAAEVLYRGPDLEHEVLVPAFVTSVIAYSVFGSIYGFHPLFVTPSYVYTNVFSLVPFAVLGVICAAGARAYTSAFYGVRNVFFNKLKRIPDHVKPAIGGLLTGMVGFFLPEALGTGYGVIQACFNQDAGKGPGILNLPSAHELGNMLPGGVAPAVTMAVLLGVIALGKIATTAFSIGSGGSGGVFGPAVVVGGAIGGAVGILAQHFLPGNLAAEPGAFALVGMAGFFAGAANTPISTIIMVSEMTGNYDLLVPAMLVCLISFLLCRNVTLYRQQLPSRLDAPSKVGPMARAILRRLLVKDAMGAPPAKDFEVFHVETTFGELIRAFRWTNQVCFPVVDGEGHLTGLIDADVLRAMITETAVENLVIAGDIQKPAVTVLPSETVLAAINIMFRADRTSLVVVDPADPQRPVGTLDRNDVIKAYNEAIIGTAV